ncbi:potassium channel family protein [Flavobacterium sp. DSR3-2]|uniref:potassium channel family protein n=1 Tax=Flavobacterium sp. DSR3-2 TaxID=2804634 RepID=UPI003CF29A15
MTNETPKSLEKLSFLNLIVLILSIYVLGALIVDSLCILPTETSLLLNYIDYSICIFFFVEFCIRFRKAENKIKFMRWGWIDLISCIPMIEAVRPGRLLRLIRLLRIVRAFKTTKNVVDHIFVNKAQGAFISVSVTAILLVIFSAIGILQVENDPNSNIKTAEDAIWWAYVTITTVGYGDKFPVTTEGRIIATILMTAGVGLFITFTAFVASLFVIDNRQNIESEK